MKKICVLLLAAILLIPSFLGIIPASEAATPEKKPFQMINFNSPGEIEGVDNIYGLPHFWTPQGDPGGKITVLAYNTYNIKEIALKMREDFDARPNGTRYFNFSSPQAMFDDAADDVIYLDRAVSYCEEWLREFLAEYKSIGGWLDGIILDVEYIHPYAYWIYYYHYRQGETDVYRKIVENPLYETKLRPLLVERGFPFYPANDDPNKPEIFTICQVSGSPDYDLAYHIWNQVMRNWLNDYVTEGIYKTLLEYYPKAHCNDYQARDYYGWSKVTDWDGSDMYSGGNMHHVGDSSNYNTYSYKPIFKRGSGTAVRYNKPVGHDHAIYDETAFNMTQWDAYVFKNAYAANEEKKLSAWIGHYAYGLDLEDNPDDGIYYRESNSCTPYYTEAIFHICMLNPDPLLGFVIGNEFGKMPEPITENTKLAFQIIADILHEMDRIVGYADRKPIETPATLDEGYILSGMYTGGKNYWRLTPDENFVSLEDFLVSDDGNLTFKVKGNTITFPGGKIITDGNVRKVGTYGYWIETEADVMPTVSVDADRYEKYPAFIEDFSFYDNMAFTPAAAYNQYCWTVSGTGAIVRDHALVMSGNSAVESIKVPGYVTAGDTYAYGQIWSVDVTLPADLPTDVKMNVLYADKDDGGFKIQGGKVYYDEAGAYKALADVTLAADKTYTFRRTVDLTAKTASYYIYDGAGLLGKAENVKMVNITVPVAKIGMAVANAGSNQITFDNFAIRLNCLNVTFEVYNANTGIKVADPNAAQSEPTAYRLSWTNATVQAKKGAVKAVFYDEQGNVAEEKVICAVDLAPGTDGLETGIVDHEYHSVKLCYAEWEEYTVTVIDKDTQKTSTYVHKVGDTVNLGVKIPEGYTLAGWETEDVTYEEAGEGSIRFVMPAKDVTLLYSFKVKETPSEPTDPSEPTEPGTTPDTTPTQTSDENSALPIILIVAAVVVIAAVSAVVVLKKKKA